MAPGVASVSQWKTQIAPMAWRDGRIYYHKTGSGVIAEGFSAKPDGSDERLETGSPLYPSGTQQSIEDVSLDGRYALVTVERASGGAGAQNATPGAGVNNDLWLLDLDTGSTWKIVDLLVSGGIALIWPRFNKTGTKIVWAEKFAWWTGAFESWDLHVADLVLTDGVPSLTNKQVRRSDGFFEPYGFLDDQTVLAAADKVVNVGIPQIVKVPVNPTGSVTRLSPGVWYEGLGWLAGVFGLTPNYCEFAYEMPAFTDRIMFGRTYQALNGSLEYWTMKRDGSDVQRLTYLAVPGHAQYQGDKMAIAGGIAWNPDNAKQFILGYATDLNNNYKSVMVTLA